MSMRERFRPDPLAGLEKTAGFQIFLMFPLKNWKEQAATFNNNNKLYLHDYNKVLPHCKSYLKLIIIKYLK